MKNINLYITSLKSKYNDKIYIAALEYNEKVKIIGGKSKDISPEQKILLSLNQALLSIKTPCNIKIKINNFLKDCEIEEKLKNHNKFLFDDVIKELEHHNYKFIYDSKCSSDAEKDIFLYMSEKIRDFKDIKNDDTFAFAIHLGQIKQECIKIRKDKKDQKGKSQEKKNNMNSLLRYNDTFIVGDIETTGISAQKYCEIIEIAACKIHKGEIIDTFHRLIKPEHKISKKTTEITGITNEMVKDSSDYYTVLSEFKEFIGNDILIFYNSDFDWNNFLIFYFNKICIFPENLVIDALRLAKLYLPNLSKYTLEEVSKELNIEEKNFHRAMDDTLVLTEIIKIFKNEYAFDDFSFTSQKSTNSGLKESAVIKNVFYWETPDGKHKRIYVNTNLGSLYYDKQKERWYNKDLKKEINMFSLEQDILKKLEISNIKQLQQYGA